MFISEKNWKVNEYFRVKPERGSWILIILFFKITTKTLNIVVYIKYCKHGQHPLGRLYTYLSTD